MCLNDNNNPYLSKRVSAVIKTSLIKVAQECDGRKKENSKFAISVPWVTYFTIKQKAPSTQSNSTKSSHRKNKKISTQVTTCSHYAFLSIRTATRTDSPSYTPFAKVGTPRVLG